MDAIVRKGLEVVAAQKPTTAARAAIGGMLGGVIGAVLFGPVGAAIGAGLLAAWGGHSGAIEDERNGY